MFIVPQIAQDKRHQVVLFHACKNNLGPDIRRIVFTADVTGCTFSHCDRFADEMVTVNSKFSFPVIAPGAIDIVLGGSAYASLGFEAVNSEQLSQETKENQRFVSSALQDICVADTLVIPAVGCGTPLPPPLIAEEVVAVASAAPAPMCCGFSPSAGFQGGGFSGGGGYGGGGGGGGFGSLAGGLVGAAGLAVGVAALLDEDDDNDDRNRNDGFTTGFATPFFRVR